MVGSAPQRLVDFGFNPSDDEIGSLAVSGGNRYPRRSPNPGGGGLDISRAFSARVVGGCLGVLGVASLQGTERTHQSTKF